MWFITSGPSCPRRQAGLHSSSRRFRPGAGMRLVPNTDTVPASVNRYLLPHERQVITVHQHPAILIRPIFEVLIGLAIAVWEWVVTYFVVTSQRFLLANGIVTRKVNMMPLAKVTDMTFQRSALGRLLGYGEFILESAGQDQALTNVDYLPYPEQLYLEVCGLIFKDKEDSPD